MTQTIIPDQEPDGAAFKRAMLFAGLGALSGITAGLIEWSQLFMWIYFEFPIPGTDWVWYLMPYTIAHGVVFGILMAFALQRYGIASQNHLTLIAAAVALAAFVSSNVAGGMIPDMDEGDVETSFWVLVGVVEGLLFASLTIGSLAAIYSFYRVSQKIFPALIAGAMTGGMAVGVAFAMVYPEIENWPDERTALALPLAVYTAIMLSGTGGAIGFVSRPPHA